MDIELEAKWLGADHDALRKQLREAGAICVQTERIMRRKIYDYPDRRLDKINGWIRVRDEGNKVTLSYKQLDDRSLQGTKEVTVTVDSFDATCMFFDVIGMDVISYQETKRESWELNGAQIELDTWPWIRPFIEIEAKDEPSLISTAELLGLSMSGALHGSVETAYQAEYSVTEDEVNSWPEIVFSDTPEWLVSKRI